VNRGHFVWHDLRARDLSRARAFYGALMGWANGDEGDGAASRFVKEGRGVAGVLLLDGDPEELPSHWLPHIAVDDVDAACAHAIELGGRLDAPPADGGTRGRTAVLCDPSGARFQVVAAARGAAAPDRTADFRWEELVTPDVDEARSFYGELCGWRFARVTRPDTPYWVGGRDGTLVCGLTSRSYGFEGASWLSYLGVAELATTLRRAESLGAYLINGPRPAVRGGALASVLDPAGALVGLVERVTG
jgi:predicted enzyme related to lactoylglutathione lyase